MALHLVSDFNLSVLKRFIENGSNKSGISEVFESPVNQSIPYLIEITKAQPTNDSVVIITFPEKIFPEFARAKNLESYNEEIIFEQLDQYVQMLETLSTKVKHIFSLPFCNSFNDPGYGVLNWRPHLGLDHLVAKMNVYLSEKLSARTNFFLIDSRTLTHSDSRNFSEKLWYSTKTPFAVNTLKKFSSNLIQMLNAVNGMSRKLVILDLDHTLWGGVVGENGWPDLRIGGHDHVGEAFKDFQLALKALTRRGIQLAIVSKNDENVALEAIDNHPEMVLRRNDFAAWKINWNDKAANVADILSEINLGASAVVFIDDNPVERERVKQAFPTILVPDWSNDPTMSVQSLWALGCFDVASITDEDRKRTQMYVADRSRKKIKEEVGSTDEWLSRISTKVTIEGLNESNLPRVAQLFNKTNQLNLATRRLSANEINEWAQKSGHSLLAFSVMDRFGDLGLTGVIGLAQSGDEVELVDYILSCRVMGRQVEETLFHVAVEWASKRGAKRLKAKFIPTERNRPTLDVLRKAQLTEDSINNFVWDCKNSYLRPKHVELDIPSGLLS